MAVTRQDVLHVAALARLDLTAEEVERFTAQPSALDEPFEDKARVDSLIRPSPEALPEGDA